MLVIDDEFKQRKTNKGYVWLKLFTDIVDDPEFMRLSDMSKAVYFETYVLAGRSDASGLVLSGDKPATIDGMAWFLRRSVNELQTSLNELEEAGFIELQGGHVTLCRFTSEQGPSMIDKRAKWVKAQQDSRARAKGENLTDEDKELKQETEQELKTKTKRVSSMSEQSQNVVRSDIDTNEEKRVFEGLFNDVLVLWHDIKGRDYKPTSAYNELINYWISKGVELPHIRKAFEQVKEKAGTPLYLRQIAIDAKDNDPKTKGQAQREHFRELYRQQKQNGASHDLYQPK